MAFKSFSEDFTSPSAQAWRDGKSPDNGTLGPYRSASVDAFKNGFISKMKENPRYADFFQQSFPADTAQRSQDKINDASYTSKATFPDKRINTFANDFMAKYPQGVDRGLIGNEEAVFPENLAKLRSEVATGGSSAASQNTAGIFPSKGVM